MNNQQHKICISGASGRMGQQLLQHISSQSDCIISSAICQFDHQATQDALAFIGQTSGIKPSTDADLAISQAQFLIDFTRPQASMQYLDLCIKHGTKMIIGTTGFDANQQQQIAQAAEKIAIVMAPNMSVGVNVVLKLLEIATKSLAKHSDIEISEAHHKHKVDAPSGTALAMGEVIAKAMQSKLSDCAVFQRNGIIGERQANSIGFSCIRAGDIVGDHTALFASDGERIEITHKASNRKIYAQGSLQAVRFLATKKTGLFNMFDVLGLNL